MSDVDVWEEIWRRKEEGKEIFAHAKLKESVTFERWNGHDAKPTVYFRTAGSTVLITMASRFGDIGIRGERVSKEIHGYDARVPPEILEGLTFLSEG